MRWMRSVLVLLALVLAGPVWAAAFEEVVLASQERAEASETVFATDTPVLHLTAVITDEVPSGSKITVAWISVDSGGAAPANYKIEEVSFDVGMLDNRLNATLSKPTNGWPVGTYRVEIGVDGEVRETVGFEVGRGD